VVGSRWKNCVNSRCESQVGRYERNRMVTRFAWGVIGPEGDLRINNHVGSVRSHHSQRHWDSSRRGQVDMIDIHFKSLYGDCTVVNRNGYDDHNRTVVVEALCKCWYRVGPGLGLG